MKGFLLIEFLKVDNEVGERVNGEPVAPRNVGSITTICSSHIIVPNYGNSRAVLYCGKRTSMLHSSNNYLHPKKPSSSENLE